MLHGLATFPGVQRVLGCEVTLAPGIQPSVATLSIAPQEPPASAGGLTGGLLELTYGGVRVRWPDCRVTGHRFETTERGRVWHLTVVDRRWRWEWGSISGRYNVCRDDGSLDPLTERSPQALASLCLDSLGERGYDVSLLPNGSQPFVAWNDANPAQALERLAASLGCRVVLRLDSTVALWPLGVGRELPMLPEVQTLDRAAALPPRPDAIAVVAGATRFQHDFPLEAVGLDRDGVVRPIDELAYRPRGGWKTADLPHFNQVNDPLDRRRARESVFRWYRIRATGLVLPGYGVIDDLSQLLPIEAEQVETYFLDAQPQSKPSQVWGVWHDPQRNVTLGNVVEEVQPLDDDASNYARRALVSAPRTIDRFAGIVRFSAPVYKLVAQANGFTIGAAELMLRTAVNVRPSPTALPLRHERVRSLASFTGTTSVHIVDHAELVRTVVPQFSMSYALLGLVDNRDRVNREYADRAPQQATYVGLVPLEPDGAIDAVTFTIGPAGCTTKAIRR